MKRSAANCNNLVDGFTVPEDISNNYAEKYQDLYNTVSLDTEDISKIRRDVNDAIHLLGFD